MIHQSFSSLIEDYRTPPESHCLFGHWRNGVSDTAYVAGISSSADVGMRRVEKPPTQPAGCLGAESCSSAMIVVSPTGQIIDLSISRSGSPTSTTADAGTKRVRDATATSVEKLTNPGGDSAPGAGLPPDSTPKVSTSRYKRALDHATGRHYWYDKETRETFWTDPTIVPFKTASEDPRKRRKTYGHPPTEVEAIGQNQGTAVWWKPPPPERNGSRAHNREVSAVAVGGEVEFDLRIIGYMVYRYRLDGGEWHKKGGTSLDGRKTASTRVRGLKNGLVYRFTVATRTVEGESAESDPSVAVRPNAPLPEGWKEIFNASTGKSVYKNLKTNQVCAERPEGNPYFVETDLFLRFSPEETDALSKAFRTRADIVCSSLVSVADITEMLPSLGESLADHEVVKGLKEDGWAGAADSTDEANVTYSQFLALLWGIKGPKMAKRSVLKRLWDGLVWMVTPRSVSAAKLALLEQDPGKRMGAWERLSHPVARRPYFVNTETGQACWTIPAEVKFFLSEELRTNLLKSFTEEELLDLRKAFAKMDLDDSGSIDADELGLIVKSFGEAVPPSRLTALIREVDHDGSGEIDFEEFTIMMQTVKKGSASLGWGRIKRNLEANSGQLDGLAEQFQGNKARGTRGVGNGGVLGVGEGSAAKAVDHGKFCLCGCRGTTAAARGRAVIYKEWGTTRQQHTPKK